MKKILILLTIFLMSASMFGCSSHQNSNDKKETNEVKMTEFPIAEMTNDGNARVFYQIFVGSFSDSNGDGIGDLRGIINRFDYLNDGDDASGYSLGVEGIWLTPIFKSPSYHKYDVANYYEIDPDFGTEEDLKELISLCHERNVKLILDLPINHTSTSNLWYVHFLNAHKENNPDHEYYNFYTHTQTPAAGRTFSLLQGTKDFVECNFSTDMPELNFDHEAVRKEVVNIAKYYLDLGIDGFRFDAAKYVYFGEESKNVEFWTWYMKELKTIKQDIYTVAEVWDGDGVVVPYYESGLNCFNFTMSQVNGRIAEAAKAGNVNTYVNYINSYLNSIHKKNPDGMLMSFISNHDMDRSAGYLTLASGQAKVAASLSILTPGSPYIYYGEEIGMKGSRGSANTDANRRLAMLWGDEDTVKNPIGTSYSSEQSNGTVQDHLSNPDSLYNHYKKLIAIRKAHPEIAYGVFTPLKTNTKFSGFISTYKNSTVVVLHNTSQSSVEVDLTQLTDVPVSMISAYAGAGEVKLEGTILTVGGQTSVILKDKKK